jgi:hypothetical protein
MVGSVGDYAAGSVTRHGSGVPDAVARINTTALGLD